MTLKQQLDTPQSPLRQFFAEYLPNTKAARALCDPAPPGAATIAVPSAPKPYPYDLVGHAFGVRTAFYFSSTTPSVASPRAVGSLSQGSIDAFTSDLEQLLDRVGPPHAGRSDANDYQLLCRYCYVLGMFEQILRVGERPEMPLMALTEGARTDDFLALAPDTCIDDLSALTSAAMESFTRLPQGPVVLAPTFTGSRDVGGADADLILGDCLLEVKTTVDATITQRTLQQVVGYALLDYDDTFRLNELAIYMSRQAKLVRLSLHDVLDAMAGVAADLGELRYGIRSSFTTVVPPDASDGDFMPCGECGEPGLYAPPQQVSGTGLSDCRYCGTRTRWRVRH